MTTPNDLNGSVRARGLRAGYNNLKASAQHVVDAGKVLTNLTPKQLKDEIQIAKIEVKEKGIALGKGAAVAAIALIFALFMTIALIILAYVGLAALMPNWAAALVLVVLFLLLAAIAGFIAFKMIKAQMPLKPESAIFGLLYDLGVLKEGSAMTAKRVKREQEERAEAKKAEKQASENAQGGSDQQTHATLNPSKEQLIQRTKQRREHLKTLRDDIETYSRNVQVGTQNLVHNAKASAKNAPANAAKSSRKLAVNASNPETLQAHWKSFATLATSLGAFFLFLGKLISRRK
ncbi:MAG: phage holin family protein [Rothia sp. (in: high G+C Gram-positive bacteria)]|nr:phage holin family protein [Rothia sp. (in: high G+C Gram-positive bacteria)]